MFEFIEKVVYINLEHRTDRRQEIESELSIFPSEKIQRFNAIKENFGALGCTKSHIAVLEMAILEGWSNYLVIEDHGMWSNFDKSYPILESLSKNPYDVIVLGAVVPVYDKLTYKLQKSQTTTSFLVNKHYYKTLLQNFKDGEHGLTLTRSPPMYALDMYWQRIQARDNWYLVAPSLVVQRPSYSDIEKKHVDYVKQFI
jgi:glycosyl transferase family 25